MNSAKMNILLLPLWTFEQWEQGRTFQKVAEQLAARPEVRRVVCLFQPLPSTGRYCFPIRAHWVSDKLVLMRSHDRLVPMDRQPYRLRRWLNDRVRHLIRGALALLGLRASNTVLWIFPPLRSDHIAAALEEFPHCLVVTQVVDNFMALEGEIERPARELAESQYPKLASRSDVVITGSKVMFDYFSGLNRNTHLMENAVDSPFLSEATELPCRLSGAAPRLGYVGFVSARTDIRLLEDIARARPEWNLVVAGALHAIAAEQIAALTALANVEYLGEVSYDRLPALIKSFDVCLIAHKDTPLAHSMSPLKFFQYLGSGRPIVSTPIEGVGRLSQYCRIGKTCSDFVLHIETELQTCTIESSLERIDAARAETWEARVNPVFSEIERRFLKKSL